MLVATGDILEVGGRIYPADIDPQGRRQRRRTLRQSAGQADTHGE